MVKLIVKLKVKMDGQIDSPRGDPRDPDAVEQKPKHHSEGVRLLGGVPGGSYQEIRHLVPRKRGEERHHPRKHREEAHDHPDEGLSLVAVESFRRDRGGEELVEIDQRRRRTTSLWRLQQDPLTQNQWSNGVGRSSLASALS